MIHDSFSKVSKTHKKEWMPLAGIEPATSRLQSKRNNPYAKEAYYIVDLFI